MDNIMTIVENIPQIITGIVGTLSGLLVISMAIPGKQPDECLQKCLDVITKFSKKKK